MRFDEIMNQISICDREIRLNQLRVKIPSDICKIDDPVVANKRLVKFLTNVIYLELHLCVKYFKSDDQPFKSYFDVAEEEIIFLLNRCNLGGARIDDNWICEELSADEVLAKNTKTGIEVRIPRFSILNSKIAKGDFLRVTMPNHSLFASPGYYVAQGGSGPPKESASEKIIRIYFNSNLAGACKLMILLTSLAKENCIKIQIKASNNHEGYNRADSLVLFLSQADLIRFEVELEYIFLQCENELANTVSLFCKKIFPGVGVAEELFSNQKIKKSFGELASSELAGLIVSKHYKELLI